MSGKGTRSAVGQLARSGVGFHPWLQGRLRGLLGGLVGIAAAASLGVLATPASAQTVADCPVPPANPILNGRVICRALIPGEQPRGLVLTDSNDVVSGDTVPFPILRIDYVGDLELDAASGDGPGFPTNTFNRFYIVSEQVANAAPIDRPPLAAEIFGPFAYGSLATPQSHLLDAATMSAITTLQAQNPNDLMVFLEIQSQADIFTGGGPETFAGVRFAEASPPQPDFLINELSLNSALRSGNRGSGNFDASVELIGSPNASLNGWTLVILDSQGMVVSSQVLDGSNTNANGYFQFDLNLTDEPGGILLQSGFGDEDALVFQTQANQIVDPQLLSVLSDPSQIPLDLSLLSVDSSYQVIPDGVKVPFETEGYLPLCRNAAGHEPLSGDQ